jgi:hypothetical protein
MIRLIYKIFASGVDYVKLIIFNIIESLSPGGAYLISKLTLKKAEFYVTVLEDGKLIKFIRKG